MHGGYRPIPKGYSYPKRILITIRVRRKRKNWAFAAGISFPLCVLSSRALHPTTTTTKLTQATILFFVLVFQTCFQYAMSSTICCFTSCMLRMVISRQKKKKKKRKKKKRQHSNPSIYWNCFVNHTGLAILSKETLQASSHRKLTRTIVILLAEKAHVTTVTWIRQTTTTDRPTKNLNENRHPHYHRKLNNKLLTN